MGFQMQICSILRKEKEKKKEKKKEKRKVLCSSANELQQNSHYASSGEDYNYSTNIDCFVRDSCHLHLTFAAFCLLSVISKQ